MPDAEPRIVRILREYDAQGIHRTGVEGDQANAHWLAAEVRAAGLEPVLDAMPGIPEGIFEVWPEGSATAETVEVSVPRGGAVRQDLVLPGEGYLNFVFFEIKKGERVRAVPPIVWLKSARDGKETRWIAEGQALRPGRYEVEFVLSHPRDGSERRVSGGSVTVKEWDPASMKGFDGNFPVNEADRVKGQGQGRSEPIETDLPKLREKLLEDDAVKDAHVVSPRGFDPGPTARTNQVSSNPIQRTPVEVGTWVLSIAELC